MGVSETNAVGGGILPPASRDRIFNHQGHEGHNGHDGISKRLRHCEELRVFRDSETRGDKAIHFFLTSKFDGASHRFRAAGCRPYDPDVRRDDGVEGEVFD
jgi:hypothetical protein